jgi:signal transduction histidine kinase
MRDRLVVALVGITVAVIGLYGVPRAYMLADLVTDDEQRNVESSAALLAVLMEEREDSGREVTRPFLERLIADGDYVLYIDRRGKRVSAGDPMPGDDSDISVTERVRGGGTLTLGRSGVEVDDRVADAVVPLILLGLVLLLVVAFVGNWLARRLSRPFSDLALRADELGHGRFDAEIPRYRIPEAERIGTSLRQAGAQLETLLRREREFAVNASHQLRTPLTALRLEIEDVALWPQTPPDVAEHLTGLLREIDRLSEAITQLLDLSRGLRTGDAVELDLTTLLAVSARRWRESLASRNRAIERVGAGPVRARVTPGPVEQILDILIENARDHGKGTVRLEARDTGTYLEIRVSDQGLPTFGPEVFRRGVTTGGTGIGLAVALGHLSVEESSPTSFVLRLPR